MLTALILYYNDPIYIRAAVSSVQSQTCSVDEILIVDNGSTDGGLKYLKTKANIRILRLDKNYPLGAARNKGLESVGTEFVAFLDSDDFWDATKVEYLLPIIQDSECHFIHTNFKHVDYLGNVISEGQSGGLHGTCANQHYKLEPISIGPPSTVLVRVQSLRQIGGFSNTLSVSADWDLNQRIARNYPVQYVDKTLVNYRVHPNNMSKNVDLYYKEMKFAIYSNFNEFRLKKSDLRVSLSKLNLIMAGEKWNKRDFSFFKYLFISFFYDMRVLFGRVIN